MLSNNQIKEIRSLKQKKFRQKYDKFIVEGHKSSVEFLSSSKYPVKNIFALESWIESHSEIIFLHRELVVPVTDKEMNKISMLQTHTDVLLVCQIPTAPVNLALNEVPVILYLDNIQDPGNVGTIIRIADWFGIQSIICSPDTADVYNSKVIQASMGSICNVDIYNIEIHDVVSAGMKHIIVGADMKGCLISEFDWPDNVIIVLGNEGRGIGDSTIKYIDQLISIGGSDNRIAESLNVANAAAIIAHSIFTS